MAPFVDQGKIHINGDASTSKPLFAIIGAGSRGTAYSAAVAASGLGKVALVVEPVEFKRNLLGSKYIWPKAQPARGQAFPSYQDFTEYEQQRRRDEANGSPVAPGVEGIFVCVRDELHIEVVTALAPLKLHLMCEKPLATTLKDCLRIQRALQANTEQLFAIGHVLRYSPHNMLLRDLVLRQKVIGDVLSIQHTEPVGWWHYSHSYVRGNWRREALTGPSLLTKSCHDIDWLLWMLCSPPSEAEQSPHLPSRITSMGSLKYFRKSRKPMEAGNATNCLRCTLVDTCMYSAKRIYYDNHFAKGNTRWPVDIVNPEVGTILRNDGVERATETLMKSLSEDYNAETTTVQDIESRPWYGRCVWESDNDVCDDQHVTIEWDDDSQGRSAKTASFHMIAQTKAICERRGYIYGTSGEIYYDGSQIVVNDFTNDSTKTHHPEVPEMSHHGGGDQGLTEQFVKAVAAVKSGKMVARDAQVEYMGMTLEEAVRSHAAVFAAEDARKEKRVVNWKDWWASNVESQLQQAS